MLASRNINSILPFSLFIQRQNVIRLYREMLRYTKKINDIEVKNGIIVEIRAGFKLNKDLSEFSAINSLLLEGKKHLKQIKALSSPDEYDSDSWINKSEGEDLRGRVGSGWPWEKKT